MFEKVDMQYGTESQVTPKSDKNIILTPSLLMRLFEWCHEDAKDDVAMHRAFEKIIAFSDGTNPLNMDCYDCIIADSDEKTNEEEQEGEDLPCADDEDIAHANDLGKCLANAGVDLSSVDYSDIAPVINKTRDGLEGYGSSNAELESFWNGYECEPLKQGCFTEIDMSDAARTTPAVISLTGDEECCDPCCDTSNIDDDLMAQINQVINAARL